MVRCSHLEQRTTSNNRTSCRVMRRVVVLPAARHSSPLPTSSPVRSGSCSTSAESALSTPTATGRTRTTPSADGYEDIHESVLARPEVAARSQTPGGRQSLFRPRDFSERVSELGHHRDGGQGRQTRTAASSPAWLSQSARGRSMQAFSGRRHQYGTTALLGAVARHTRHIASQFMVAASRGGSRSPRRSRSRRRRRARRALDAAGSHGSRASAPSRDR
jgi:hypothetical protein